MNSPVKEQPRLDPAFTGSSLERASDDRLVTLARGGLDVAVEAIVHRYRTALVQYAVRFLDPDQAEEVVEEAFVKGLMAIETDTKRVQLRSWLYRIVHSEAVNAARRRSSPGEAHDEGDGEAKSAEYLARVERLRSIVVGANRPEPAIARAEAVERSPEEIANDLAATRANVAVLIHRARAGLRTAGDTLVPAQKLRSWFENLSSPGMRGLVTAGAAAVVVATVAGAATLGRHGGSLDSGSSKSPSASSAADSKPKVAGSRRNGGTRAPVEPKKSRQTEAHGPALQQAPVAPSEQVAPPVSNGNVAGGSETSRPKNGSKPKKSKPKEGGSGGSDVIVLGEKKGTTSSGTSGTSGTQNPPSSGGP